MQVEETVTGNRIEHSKDHYREKEQNIVIHRDFICQYKTGDFIKS